MLIDGSYGLVISTMTYIGGTIFSGQHLARSIVRLRAATGTGLKPDEFELFLIREPAYVRLSKADIKGAKEIIGLFK